MDGVVGALIQRLKDYNLFDSTNIMIVNVLLLYKPVKCRYLSIFEPISKISDHGMGHIKSPEDYILLSEHFDTSIIDSRKTIYSKISQVYPVSEDLVNYYVMFSNR